MIKNVGVLLSLGLILIACTSIEQESLTTNVTSPPNTPVPCTLDYSTKWHYVVGSQVDETNDAELHAEATAFLQGIHKQSGYYEGCCHYEEARIYTLQHPDNPDILLVEYDLPYGVHHLVGTTLLQRMDKDWTKLTVPSYPTIGFHAEDADLMGYVWECDGWTLYLGIRNTEKYSGSSRPETTVFHQSRDNGKSWLPEMGSSSPLSYYGFGPNRPIEPPSIPLEGTVLSTVATYDSRYERLIRFAWIKDTRTLYAFSYPFILTHKTPQPSATP